MGAKTLEKLKKKILFVGSFKKAGKDGSVGGQMFACHSLINSSLSDEYEWVLIDSTADSNTLAPIYKRAWKAIKRVLRFLYHLFFSKIDIALIFTADGLSFVEKGSMSLMAKFFRKKVILTPLSGLVVNDIENSAFMRWFIPFILRRVDIITCQGESWKQFYYQLINQNEEKFIVIQNWIDIAPYPEKDSYNTSDKLKVLFLSWVDRNKGIFDLIEAAAQLKPDFPNIQYEIAGDGMAMKESQELVKRKGLEDQVIFHGWVTGNDKITLLTAADIYVLPSYFEGFPYSLIEAMTSSLIVVTTKVGAIPDLVKDEVNGLLFDKGDVKAFSEKLRKAYEEKDLRKRLAKNARKTIIENNTIDVAVNKFKKIFKDIY